MQYVHACMFVHTFAHTHVHTYVCLVHMQVWDINYGKKNNLNLIKS